MLKCRINPAEAFNQAAYGKNFDIMIILSQPGGKLKTTEYLHKHSAMATK
jgi:hypothetical protein